MTCRDEDETPARMVPNEGQENQAPTGYTPPAGPSIVYAGELTLYQAREVACAALILYHHAETLTWQADYGMTCSLNSFRDRMRRTLRVVPLPKWEPQPPADQGGPGAVRVTAAESAASTPAEAQERVEAKRQIRRATTEVPA